MKCRIDTMSCKIKKVIEHVATNIATITRELYAVDREERIAQISERKRRIYKFIYHAINVISTIVLFAINYLIMWIIWQIIMYPPFGKAKYTFPFEDNLVILNCFISIISLYLFTRWIWAKEYPHIEKFIRLIPFVPISGVIGIYMADIGKVDILLQIFYLYILRFICNSLSKAITPIVYPYIFLSQGVSMRRAVQKPDQK
ncbi:hypothetical protein MKA38_09075 [[Clostridium] innocuum]|nr:hypothetical protein [[Clostridium] innocuum]